VQVHRGECTAGPGSSRSSGELAASDPDTLDTESLLGRVIVLTVVQLAQG
jgi:hypothetical protein